MVFAHTEICVRAVREGMRACTARARLIPPLAGRAAQTWLHTPAETRASNAMAPPHTSELSTTVQEHIRAMPTTSERLVEVAAAEQEQANMSSKRQTF